MLSGDRVVLRPLRPDDLEPFWQARQDPLTWARTEELPLVPQTLEAYRAAVPPVPPPTTRSSPSTSRACWPGGGALFRIDTLHPRRRDRDPPAARGAGPRARQGRHAGPRRLRVPLAQPARVHLQTLASNAAAVATYRRSASSRRGCCASTPGSRGATRTSCSWRCCAATGSDPPARGAARPRRHAHRPLGRHHPLGRARRRRARPAPARRRRPAGVHRPAAARRVRGSRPRPGGRRARGGAATASAYGPHRAVREPGVRRGAGGARPARRRRAAARRRDLEADALRRAGRCALRAAPPRAGRRGHARRLAPHQGRRRRARARGAARRVPRTP